jgi:hypothetical protein
VITKGKKGEELQLWDAIKAAVSKAIVQHGG